MNQSALDQLIRENPALWRGRQGQERTGYSRLGDNAVDTGYPALNDLLPTGGWPLRAIVEIQVSAWGNGELQPLLPLMARLTSGQSRVAMVAPPHIPYAPALAQSGVSLPWLIVVDMPSTPAGMNRVKPSARGLVHRGGRKPAPWSTAKEVWWAAEKLLRHPDCGLVLAWPSRPDAAQVRRLQLAADASNSIGIVFRAGKTEDTPVGLRLQTERCAEGVKVRLVKSRYGWRQHGEVVLPNRMTRVASVSEQNYAVSI